MLIYCVRLSQTFVSRRDFRHEILRLLVKSYHVKTIVFWAGSKHTDLMLTVFLFPLHLWNSLTLLIDRLANMAKEEKELQLKKLLSSQMSASRTTWSAVPMTDYRKQSISMATNPAIKWCTHRIRHLIIIIHARRFLRVSDYLHQTSRLSLCSFCI